MTIRAKLLYASVAVAALAAGIAVQRWMGPDDVPREAIVEPPLHDLDGQPHRLAEWRGQVVVLNFWATWCAPCREEMPAFVRLQKEFARRGLRFVGVAIDDPKEVRAFLKENPVNYPILIGDEKAPGWADQLGNTLSALPFSVVFDREGQVAYAHTGVFKREQVLKAVQPLLDRSSAK
jgi:thiol-disulfide isomerase/thioredoxin